MDERVKTYEDKMQKAYDFLATDYQSIRAGRANPHVLDKIRVDYYGTPTPLQQVGNISVPEPRVIQIAPWEKKLIKDIEKAIMASDVGITPSNDGNVIRLVFPELTEERRKDLVKQVKIYGDETKVVIRNNRRDAIDKMRSANKKKELTDDLLKEFEEKVQKITDKFTAEVDKVCETKNKELMEI